MQPKRLHSLGEYFAREILLIKIHMSVIALLTL